MAAKKSGKKVNKAGQGSRTAKSGGSSKKTTAASKQVKAKTEQRPIRREVGAIVCFFFGVFTLLSLFNVKSVLTSGLIAPLFKGLLGQVAFYILPFAFFLAFVILLFHGGRPVCLRVICTFFAVLGISAMTQIMASVPNPEWGLKMFAVLYRGGISGVTGGAVGGVLGMLFSTVFSKIGAAIILVALIIICLTTSLNMTISSIIRAVRNRPRLQYEEPEEEWPEPAETIVNHVANRHIEHVQKAQKKRAADYDLPVDDPPIQEEEQPARAKGRGRKANVQSPDQFIMDRREAAKQAPEPPADPEEELELLQQMNLQDYAEPDPVQQETPVEPKAPLVDPMPAPEGAEKLKPGEAAASMQEIAQQISEQESDAEKPAYQLPPISLLLNPQSAGVDGTAEMRENKKRLDETLQSFNIDAHIVNVTRGPSVTRYELELDRGVKLAKITNLSDDIALALGASGVRISAIPNKVSVVGIEVPNKLVSTVYAREVIDSSPFRRAKSKISFAVGKDISGNCIVGDIAKLPHLLIAGTTGSGKSVCMNSLIVSLLYEAKPDEVKLIMVDPKMVELGIYNGIPHLLIPVVTDPKKAAGALQWAVTEMMRRYRMMADAGVRNLEEYNKLASVSEEYDKMPQMVVVIDELADLMLVAAKEVEEAICRVAQMGRASGIHLIVATQRPSADVITGLMKANIPSRIAFAVASATESRIILDTMGAEKLVGKGDMLFAPLGQGKPKRVQGCFITDEEVQSVVQFIKKQSQTDYADEVLQEIERKAEQSGKPSAGGAPVEQTGGDELLPAAVEVILETGQASVSMLQRRLKLGYARAARIVDEMEDKGIVGPFEGSKPRRLLITKEQWQAMQNGEEAPAPEPVEEEIP